jgi:hypothetical protein
MDDKNGIGSPDKKNLIMTMTELNIENSPKNVD